MRTVADPEVLRALLARLYALQPETRRRPAHGFFGSMAPADWQRWAYKHTDHHLRQFGL